MTQSEIASLQITPLVLTIEDVYFSSYRNPSTVNIVVSNPHSVPQTITVKLHIDNYTTSTVEITDTVPPESMKTMTKPVSELNLTSGQHFLYCSF